MGGIFGLRGVTALQPSGIKLSYVVAAAILTLASTITVLQPIIANAEPSQVGAQQVTINPGGGIETDGSDGLRFTINSDEVDGGDDWDEALAGQDGVVYKETRQYCCGGGGPLLNIGGTLYGQSGAADYYSGEVAAWDSITILSTTGSTATGARTSTTGSGTAKVRYSITHAGLTYLVDRTVSYTYPNNYVTDKYSFTIPAGNTKTVKFYLGGDTAPGSSDNGYGIMLTEPLRTIISLNPDSNILFGFREVPNSKKFDGATSQDYELPYEAMLEGGNIGFVVDDDDHDAGLMMQWNLGSTQGTYTYSLRQFVGSQATNLAAGFSAEESTPGSSVKLNLSIENTLLTAEDGLGFTFTLPSGLVVAAGSSTNSCGGSVTATAGGSTIVVSGAEVGAATNCVVGVPVVAAAVGTYNITSGSVSGLAGGLVNDVGSASLEVIEANITNDKNGDGILDSTQRSVSAITSDVSTKTVVLEVDENCAIDSSLMKGEASNEVQDAGYSYPEGMLNFNVDCGDPGYTTTIKQYYFDVTGTNYVLRKHNPVTGAYFAVPGGTVSTETIYGQTVTVATYQVTDGGTLDIDGEENGIIVDPAGLALGAATAPNTGFGRP